MLKWLLCLIISFVGLMCQAQARNSSAVYLEFVGASISIGINYDSRFPDSRFGYRVGIAYTIGSMGEMFTGDGLKDEKIRGINVPIELNCLIGKSQKKSKFELGVGVNLGIYEHAVGYSLECGGPTEPSTVEKDCMFGYFAFGNIGYRYQRPKGFLFRIGISPKFDFGDKNGIDSYVGVLSFIPYLSFGYSF